MTDLDYLRDKVPGYADYGDHTARHRVDQQVRALVGEALAGARERLRPSGELGEHLDRLVVRCEFSDQRLVRAEDHGVFSDGLVDRVHALDRAIVDCAGRIVAAATGDELRVALAEAGPLLDQRFGAIIEAPSE